MTESSTPSNFGSPIGPVTSSSIASVCDVPHTSAINSARTHDAEVAWYSNSTPGSEVVYHAAILTWRVSASNHSGGPSGARGIPAVCSSRWWTRMAFLPPPANHGSMSITAVVSSRRPAPSRRQVAAAMSTFDVEYMGSRARAAQPHA